MKKFHLLLTGLLIVSLSFAQSEKYTKAMESLLPAVDTTHGKDNSIALANSFERIANAEKTQWLPYYYAALSYINAGYSFSMDGGFSDKSADIDPLADKADQLLTKADELEKNNSEIWVLRKLLASLRMMGNPMARFQEHGPLAAAALNKAKELDPGNPRVFILEGQDLFFTPEQFGGNKAEAKKKWEEAKIKFETFKPKSAIHPNWGMSSLIYFLSQVK
jgi:hypothetical protein